MVISALPTSQSQFRRKHCGVLCTLSDVVRIRAGASFVFSAGNQACLEMSNDLVGQAAYWHLFFEKLASLGSHLSLVERGGLQRLGTLLS